jgi:NhaP-type Na+/H+ or K+/H+ antiporter
MRYVVAIVFAVIGAALAAVFLGSSVADWVVSHQSFDSSDDAENLHMLTFVGSLVVGLLVGWLVGWIIGGAGGSSKPTA